MKNLNMLQAWARTLGRPTSRQHEQHRCAVLLDWIGEEDVPTESAAEFAERFEEVKPILDAIDRDRARKTPRQAAAEIRAALAKPKTIAPAEYDPQAVWLALRARSAK
ncbi:hypothetical protein HLB44_25445 [Aquincola sp. S2]|uniref:Uncharacterized protein n=1 Tax=Pseudaquabacterium terrae TaxID=2732868 RepID=A0ABX2EPE4_9BURK|nr:hypothetical protein [Aquabacterium terrae]NRF70359.1 hypothetical protein [Aquabacterium terrae]